MRRKLSWMICLCTVLIIGLVFSTAALANERKENRKNPEVVLDPVNANGPLDLDKSQLPSLAEITEPVGQYAIVVYINEPCDEEWRAKYPSNWMYWANYAVELADNKLYEWFGIDYWSVAQNVWYSSSTTAQGLLDEAIREIGRTNGADIMVAYSGQWTGYGGIAYVGQPYTCVFWQGSAYDWIVTRHETGHNYGLYHCTSACIMNSYPYPYADSICSTHRSQWYNNRYRY